MGSPYGGSVAVSDATPHMKKFDGTRKRPIGQPRLLLIQAAGVFK